jgi:hypothetical protein
MLLTENVELAEEKALGEEEFAALRVQTVKVEAELRALRKGQRESQKRK